MSTTVSSDEVVFTGLMPHAPILASGVGTGKQHREVRRTIDAMAELARHAVAARPDTIVIISPHSPRRNGAFGIWRMPELRGSLELFGAPENRVELPLDTAFADRLAEEAARRGLQVWPINLPALDYGATVPLSYLVAAGWHSPTVVVGLSTHGESALDDFGAAIGATASGLRRRIALIASGDMSHRLGPGAPLGFTAEGSRFDQSLIELLRGPTRERIRELDRRLVELAAEDVVESTRVALTASGYATEGSAVLSYEGPFGVGYGVVILSEKTRPETEAAAPGGATHFAADTLGHFADLPGLARLAVEAQFEGGPAEPPMKATGALATTAGVFVTIRNTKGRLRGCTGTASPTRASLLHETWFNARAAAFSDPRFPALRPEEMKQVQFSVSILSPLEPVVSLGELDPVHYGILVTGSDGRSGLLLPGLAGIDSVTEQARLAKHKGGMADQEHVRIQRFTTRTHQEPPPSDDESR